MKFGKLPDIDHVDFRLPPDPEANLRTLSGVPPADGRLSVYLGCTGWSMKEWVGSVYPRGAKSKDFLRYYSEQFNTIELNTTHYRIPDKTTIEKWRAETVDDFHFCPKIPQTISHSADLGAGSGQTLAFCDAIQGLEEKSGCCFIQLPPYFGIDRLPVLERFLQRFPDHIPLAVEVRHESWFEIPEAGERFFQLLEHYGVSAVITDVAGRRDVLHMRLTNGTAMVRFVGNGLHPSDYSRVDEWTERIAQWAAMGLRSIYFFTHEPDNILAPELAVYLFNNLQNLDSVRTRGPKLLRKEDENKQMSLF
jgi:uncharacterized protein YecE (DUF72 family)